MILSILEADKIIHDDQHEGQKMGWRWFLEKDAVDPTTISLPFGYHPVLHLPALSCFAVLAAGQIHQLVKPTPITLNLLACSWMWLTSLTFKIVPPHLKHHHLDSLLCELIWSNGFKYHLNIDHSGTPVSHWDLFCELWSLLTLWCLLNSRPLGSK